MKFKCVLNWNILWEIDGLILNVENHDQIWIIFDIIWTWTFCELVLYGMLESKGLVN